MIFDWWSFEILAIFAGFINVEATGAQVILLNIFYTIFMSGTGI